MNLAGKYRLPMSHQPNIVAIVTTQIVEIVGEVLSLCPQLLKATKAVIHGVTDCIDNFRIGHGQ